MCNISGIGRLDHNGSFLLRGPILAADASNLIITLTARDQYDNTPKLVSKPARHSAKLERPARFADPQPQVAHVLVGILARAACQIHLHIYGSTCRLSSSKEKNLISAGGRAACAGAHAARRKLLGVDLKERPGPH